MKKYFHKFVFAVSILGIMGFGDCQGFGDWVANLFMSQVKVKGGVGDSSGENEIYSIVVGEGGAIMTSDGVGPVDWIERQSGTTETLNFVEYHPYSADWTFFAVGNHGTVLYSTDKGHNWENRSISSFSFNLYGTAYFGNPFAPGLAVCGESGMVCISTDGGFNWGQHATITTNKLNSMMSYGSDHYVIVGDNGTIIKGGPGVGWENKSVDPNIHLNRIYNDVELEWSDLWAVGSEGKIYYSSNYGIDWTTRNSGVTSDLYDIKFRSGTDGMIVGAGGVVRYTTNAGLTWLSDPYFDGLTNGDIRAISIVDTNTASAIVHNATESRSGTLILSVSTEPFTDVKDDGGSIPSAFRLEQNYPNPFNPSTKLSFVISQLSLVTLRVYDLLGREVAVLVNEEKPAGTYEINFDASGLSSGVYYYQLQATPVGGQAGDEFVETKKLVLLK